MTMTSLTRTGWCWGSFWPQGDTDWTSDLAGNQILNCTFLWDVMCLYSDVIYNWLLVCYDTKLSVFTVYEFNICNRNSKIWAFHPASQCHQQVFEEWTTKLPSSRNFIPNVIRWAPGAQIHTETPVTAPAVILFKSNTGCISSVRACASYKSWPRRLWLCELWQTNSGLRLLWASCWENIYCACKVRAGGGQFMSAEG